MLFKKLSRKIKIKPLVRLRKRIQESFYKTTGNMGSFLFNLLRALRFIAQIKTFEATEVKNILVIRPDRIGDLILATPVFYNLRKHFPEAKISLLIHEANKDLVSNNPNINALFTLKKRGISAIFFENLIGQIKGRKFDLAVVLYPSFWSCLLVFLSDIPHRLGYDFHGSAFLLTLKLDYKCKEIIKHEVDVNLDLLTLIGINPEEKALDISIDSQAEINIAKFLEANGIYIQERIAVIHPGAYEEYIRWKVSGFAAVADFLISEYKMRVIILGGANEESLVNKVSSLMTNKAIMATGLMLSETVSLIKRARIFIGNSKGPMHIAAALKVPVVAIFGNKHPLDCYQKWAPYGTRNEVVHKDVNCGTCDPSECIHYRCLEEIGVADVVEAIVKLI